MSPLCKLALGAVVLAAVASGVAAQDEACANSVTAEVGCQNVAGGFLSSPVCAGSALGALNHFLEKKGMEALPEGTLVSDVKYSNAAAEFCVELKIATQERDFNESEDCPLPSDLCTEIGGFFGGDDFNPR